MTEERKKLFQKIENFLVDTMQECHTDDFGDYLSTSDYETVEQLMDAMKEYCEDDQE